MTIHQRPSGFIPSPRGLLSVSAETGVPDLKEINKLITDVLTAHNAFKSEVEASLKQKADVLTTEKIERMNVDISGLQAAIDEANRAIAAAQLNGVNQADKKSPARAAYDSLAEAWLRKGGNEDQMKPAAIKAALTTQSEPDGGYFVPTEYDAEISRVIIRLNVMRSLARVVPVGSMVFKKAFLTTGASFGWVGEEQARPETNSPRWNEQAYPTMELYANASVTQGMLDDSMFDPASFLGEEYGRVFAEAEGAAYITGTGVLQPRGLLSYPVFQHTATPDADVVPWGQIASMQASLQAVFSSGAGGSWIKPGRGGSPAR
jgi:HK97 family phage major capsid protein